MPVMVLVKATKESEAESHPPRGNMSRRRSKWPS
jgi:hypothetical protein